MGTNFYMMSRNKELVENYFPFEYEIVDTPYFGYKIHIGKRSMGWKPIFREHHKAYNSVEERELLRLTEVGVVHVYSKFIVLNMANYIRMPERK